ncbi:hypothetical protein PC117_g7266 [Phytophthora cactorum]|uniref:Uncharacterized protein n=1 Tax=Phytophthora cactorum TaxID=29920 RepID=A0A8T1E0V8_9STRA|nr:hypothetical protein PC117_g7266 [Phytophthora cactorum]
MDELLLQEEKQTQMELGQSILPPLIQPLRLSAFTQKTCSQFGIPLQDLAHEWVVLFRAISGGKVLLQIPDTVLLSPSGQPSVWYTTSSAGRVKAMDLTRVSPKAILEAFETPLPSGRSCKDDIIAVRRLGFKVENLSRRKLKVFCRDMEYPIITELSSTGASSHKSVRSELIKGVFCLQRHIPCQNNASFLIVWRHSLNSEQAARTTHSRTSDSTIKNPTPRARSDVFLWAQPKLDSEQAVDNIEDNAAVNENQSMLQSDHQLSLLDIVRPDGCTSKILRRGGFDPDVMTPLLFYMKRVTSELANYINLGHNTKQACGLACEFFVGEHNQSVYFSALRGIHGSSARRRDLCSPGRSRSPLATDRAVYYEQNPRFPSIHTPFSGEKQWLHRSQLLAPSISPRYVGASVPKIYRDGVFQSLLAAHQADSVVRLNLSPQAPATLAEIRREQPHLSPRSTSLQRKAGKE